MIRLDDRTGKLGSILVIILLVIAFSSSFISVAKASNTSNFVAYTSASHAIRFNDKSFYYNGRYWLFWNNGTGGDNNVFSSSTDGITWLDAVSIGHGSTESGLGENLDAILSNGLAHIFVRDAGGISYRSATPETDGTLTWSDDWVLAYDYGLLGGTAVDFDGAIDSNGYPWISQAQGPGISTQTVYVTKSMYNNGSWVTTGGYPVAVATYYTNNFLGSLSDGKMYLFYFIATTGTAYPIKGKLWTGSSWSAEEVASTIPAVEDYAYGSETYSKSVYVDASDGVHFAYVSQPVWPDYTPYRVIYVKRTYGVGWGTPQTVASNTMRSACPALAYYSAHLYCFWIANSENINVKVWTDTGWDYEEGAIYDADNIPTFYDYGYNGRLNAFPELMQGKLGLFYVTYSGYEDVFKIKFSVIYDVPTPPGIPSEMSIVDISSIPAQFALVLTVPLLAGQLIATAIVLMLFLLPTLLITKNIMAAVLMGFVALGVCLALGWLPYWLFIVVAVAVALMFGSKIRDMMGGKGGED